MTKTFFRKRMRQVKRWGRKHKSTIGLGVLAGALVVGSYVFAANQRKVVDPATYANLLNLIARVESRGNYNAYFGNASNQEIIFTNMTIAEVQQWQQDYVAGGSPSSAVGRYQIIRSTLGSLIDELQLDVGQKFDQPMQDKMAMALLERRGAEAYVNDEISQKEFAANLAKEWAALPRVIGEDPSASFYAGDGLNASLVGVDEVLGAIDPISARAI